MAILTVANAIHAAQLEISADELISLRTFSGRLMEPGALPPGLVDLVDPRR